MARTIEEIKESIAGEFTRDENVALAYGFTPGEDFAARFSKVSVESVLFHVFAVAAWVLEKLFDKHRQEVNDRVEEMVPHRPRWYRDKTLAFMDGKALIPDTDRYDTTGASDAEIAAARVVKHAVAVENPEASILTIKVAGESAGERCPLDAGAAGRLAAYLAEIKDAGVRVNLVNLAPDTFNCEVDVYHDPLLLPEGVEAACRAAIRAHVENLPFNGEYTNMALVDALQRVEGASIVEFRGASTSAAGESVTTPVNGRHVPAAGYFVTGQVTINMIPHEQA
ncbi:MAG: hypothetical protein LBP56_07695 [Odoribacteraceae bacterium]|jgi:hypothetical protein|nr:hypothetical protein [Odoribacteraceae bacterium]